MVKPCGQNLYVEDIIGLYTKLTGTGDNGSEKHDVFLGEWKIGQVILIPVSDPSYKSGYIARWIGDKRDNKYNPISEDYDGLEDFFAKTLAK